MRSGHIQIGGLTLHVGEQGISNGPSLEGILQGKRPLPQVANPFEEGKKAFGEKRYADALEYFSRDLTKNSKNAWACYYVGRTYAALNVDEHAKAMFGKAVELRPAFGTQDYEEAKREFDKGEYLHALWAVERAAVVAQYVPEIRKKIKNSADLALQIGDAYIAKQDCLAKDRACAQRAYATAVALEPQQAKNIAKHCHNLAKQYTDKKEEITKPEYRKAQALLESALAAGETNPWAHYRLGKCYRALGDHNAARDAFQKVLATTEKGSQLYAWASSRL